MKASHHTLLYLLFILASLTGTIYGQEAPEDIEYLSSISEDLGAPLRIASDATGKIYVTDALLNTISKFDASGNLLETIHSVESPISVAVNKEGNLFIGDGATGSIYKYDQGGTTVFYSGTMYPTSMEFGPENILYLVDSKLQEVIALDLSANVVQTIGTGVLDFPTGIAVDHGNRRILVGEHGGSGTGFKPVVKVYMFDLQGNLIKSFGSHGSGDGQFYRIQGLSVAKCGNIYVVDPYQSRISVFDERGVFIEKFGDFGLGEGQLNVPMDINFDSQERLLVTSMNNGAIELFSFSDTLPSSNMRSGTALICLGESTDIEISFTGTAPWTFTYTIDGLNPATIVTVDNPYYLSASEAGHYEIIELLDANYTGTCFTGSADVIVTNDAPTAHMTGDAVLCEGETAEISIEFTGSPPWDCMYSLNGKNPSSVTTTNNPYLFQVSEAGIYEVSALSGGACSGTSFTGSAEIFVNPLPGAVMTDGNGQIYIDPGESASLSVELSGSPPWEITYTTDDRSPVTISNINTYNYDIITSEPGSYEIKVVTDSKCTSTETYGFPELVLIPTVVRPTSNMDGGDFSMCPEESVPVSVHFSGMAPWTFTYAVETTLTTTIFNTYTNPYIINALYEGTYEVIALSDNRYTGNEFTGYALVSILQPVPDFTHSANNLEVSFNNISEKADSYYWDFGDGTSSVETNPLHLYTAEGEYVVSLTGVSELCDDITLSRTILIEAVSAESTEFDGKLSIYPNPSDGLVTIEINSLHKTEVSMDIIDVNGKIVYSGILHPGSVAEEINLAHFSSGLYYVRVISKDYLGIRKLILNTN